MTSIDRITGVSTSVAVKAPCRVATTANITLSGLQTIDGVTVVADDRVLVKNQTTASENGIYYASSGNWQRTPDFDGSRDVVKGTLLYVHSGTTNGNSLWRVTTADAITIGTSSIAFGQVTGFDGAVTTTYTITDSDGNVVLRVQDNAVAGAATGVGLFPGRDASTQNAEFFVLSSARADCGISFRFKGAPPVPYGFHASAGMATRLMLYEDEDNGSNYVAVACPDSVASSITWTLPGAVGNANDVWYHSTGGVLTSGRPITVAHAVASFNPSGTPAYIRSDGFTGSITDNGTGDFTLTMSAATSDSASIVLATADGNGTAVHCTASQPSTTTIRVRCFDAGGSAVDPTRVFVAVFGAPA